MPELPEEKTVYTLPEIAKASGADYRTLNNWLRRGLFVPSLRLDSGPGNAGFYSAKDASLIHKLVELRNRGLGIDALVVVADLLRQFDCAACPICEGSEIRV
jgi:DNA-binding transcriptional MerR regulator